MDYDYFESNSTDDYNMTAADAFIDAYIAPPLIATIAIFGLIGNGTLLYILRKTNARNAPNVLIFNLAVADIIVILFYMPLNPVISFKFDTAVCKMTESLNDIASGVTAFSLVALSAYCYLDHETTPTPTPTPTRHSGWTRRTTIVVVTSVWTLATIFTVPTMLLAFVEPFDEDPSIVICRPYHPELYYAVSYLRCAIYYVLPLITVSYFYCTADKGVISSVQRSAQRECAGVVAISLVVVYATCFFLVNFVEFLSIFPFFYGKFFHIVDVAGYFLTLAYRSLNPVTLYCASGTFRNLFNGHLLCWCTSGKRDAVLDRSGDFDTVPVVGRHARQMDRDT